MPAHADKTSDRSSSMSLDLDQTLDATSPESATEEEEAVGNAASVDAMMEAEADEPDADGGILASMMGAEEEAAAEPADEAAPSLDVPELGDGRLEDDRILDMHGTPVEEGCYVAFDRGSGDIRVGVFSARIIEEDDEPDWYEFQLSTGGSVCTIAGDDGGVNQPFAVVDEATYLAYQATLDTPEAGGPAEPAHTDLRGKAAFKADQIINAQGTHSVKIRTDTDDLYRQRGMVDAAGASGLDRRMRKAIPKALRAKRWSDAKDEFDALEHAELAKKAPKYRKMLVRAVERLDDYSLQIEAARAMGEATYEEVYAEWEAAELAGDSERQTPAEKSLATIKEHKDKLDEGGPKVQRYADQTHEQSQEVVRWSDQVALQSASDTARVLDEGSSVDLAAKERTYEEWVSTALDHRTEAKGIANIAHGLTRGITDEAVFGTRTKSFLGRKAKRAKKGAKSGAAGLGARAATMPISYLTGGMVDVEDREVDGGKGKKRGVNFNTWKSNYRRVKAECAQIEESSLYGENTGLYNALKMMTDFGLPTLNGVLKALVVWGLILTPVSMGIGLGLSATAGTLSLVVSALKGVLELVLALWSAKKVEDYTDRDARKKKLAKAERWKHGKGLVEDAATVASLSVASTTASGKQLSPSEATSKRFTDITNTEGRGLGKVSTTGAGKTVGIGKVPAPSAGGLDTSTMSSKSVGGAAGRAVDSYGQGTRKSGAMAEKERKDKLAPSTTHAGVAGLSAADGYYSAHLAPGSAPEGPAPTAPGAAPRGPAPAPPSAEAEAPAEVSADPEKAAAEGSKVKRLSSKVASGLASAAGKVTGLPEEAREKDPDADQHAADLAQIAADAAEVGESLP